MAGVAVSGDEKEKGFFLSTLVVGVIIGFVITAISVSIFPEGAPGSEWWKRQSVAHHAAHYDPDTGKWQWNDK